MATSKLPTEGLEHLFDQFHRSDSGKTYWEFFGPSSRDSNSNMGLITDQASWSLAFPVKLEQRYGQIKLPPGRDAAHCLIFIECLDALKCLEGKTALLTVVLSMLRQSGG